MKLKKSLGQHFLHNAFYLNAVADAAEVKKGDSVLEVGPGDGALTEVLLARGAKVIAVEKDARLIPILKEKFKNKKKFKIIEGDVLRYDISYQLGKYKVAGNIPYYITGALLKKFLSAKLQPKLLVFLVQKEVAERIARGKKESVLSLSVKVYGEPKIIKTVPRGAFYPAPKVDSAILAVNNISRKNFKRATHEKKFFELVRAGFSQKRKQLKNTLKHSDILRSVGVSENARAEDIGLAQWLALSKY